MAPSLRIILALLGVTSTGLVLVAALIYGSLDRLGLRTAEANSDFLLTQLRTAIETNVGLGLPLADIRIIQDLIERAQASDRQVLALEVLSPTGVSLFNTDRGSIGETIPAAWREAIRYRIDNDRWRVEELGNLIIGQAIRNDFGEPVGYLAVTVSGEARRELSETVAAGLVRRMATVLPVMLILVGLVAATVFGLASRDLRGLARRLASNEAGESPQFDREAAGALATIGRAVRDFDATRANVSKLDEEEDRDAA
jgi:hypothetical protein